MAFDLLFLGRGTRRMWLIGAMGSMVGGLIASEVISSWPGLDDLQPQIDGPSFDEALLGGLVVGIPVALAAALYLLRRRQVGKPSAAGGGLLAMPGPATRGNRQLPTQTSLPRAA